MNKKLLFDRFCRRLRAEGILKAVFSGAVLMLSVNTVFSFLYWLIGFGTLWLGVAVGIPLGALLGVILYHKCFKPTVWQTARRLDREGLEERIITMVEYEGDDSYIASRQRADATDRLAGLSEHRLGIRPPTALIAITAVLLTVGILLLTLGSLAAVGRIPYGMDFFAGGADGECELVYTVSGGGYIKGDAEQSVKYGKNGTPVRAVALDGWMFVGWDDGRGSPERLDGGVTVGMTLTAIFERIDALSPDEEDSDSADDLPYGTVDEESGGGDSDEVGGDNIKDDGDGSGGGKWQDRNQFIDGATYYRDYLEFYYQYSTGIFESESDIPKEIIDFFETYFDGI